MALQVISDSTVYDSIYRELEDDLCDGKLSNEFTQYVLDDSSNLRREALIENFLDIRTKKKIALEKEERIDSDAASAYEARKQQIIDAAGIR